jgi:hypothetical protein
MLLGAFLILVEDWTLKRVVDVLGKSESQRKFPCAWAKSHVKKSSWLMTISCCWEGLELAKDQGWISTDCLSSDDLLEKVCEEYRTMVATYDAAWIIPGQILVSADPVTTMCDPNPATFSALLTSDLRFEPIPEADGDLAYLDAVQSTVSTSIAQLTQSLKLQGITQTSETPKSARSIMLQGFTSKQTSGDGTPKSTDTVCKDYVDGGMFFSSAALVGKAMAYSGFIKACGVSAIIRANFDEEPGMPMKSYNAQMWKERQVGHKDIQFEDYGGGLPLPSSVASLLETTDNMCKESAGAIAILIHCKGGFGRSVVLCCLLAIFKYDLPGSSLLGWSRIARPGAITNPKQEEFLMSMKGRADVLKFAKKARGPSGENAAHDGAKVGCGCVVQ